MSKHKMTNANADVIRIVDVFQQTTVAPLTTWLNFDLGRMLLQMIPCRFPQFTLQHETILFAAAACSTFDG